MYDLKPYSENYARLMAYSGGGDGPSSDARVFTMPEGCKLGKNVHSRGRVRTGFGQKSKGKYIQEFSRFLKCTYFSVATPVTYLEAFALSNREIGVVWKRPTEINGILKGYNVTWYKGKK